MKHLARQSRQSTARRGFTLIELLTVITIIAILLSLILPTLSGVLGSGDLAAVSAEMTQLEQALATFKSQYGEYPPSNIFIPGQGGTWNVKSRAAISKIWPQFDFPSRGGLNNADPLHLNGAECLVFFLGGIEGGSVSAPVLAGFSRNPLKPWTESENPHGPFMEFDLGRMDDQDEDGAYEYLDALPGQETPILYLSTGGTRYNKDNDPALDDYDVHVTDISNPAVDARDLKEVYMQANGKTPYRADSYQLISPGEDGEYGVGGAYTPDEDLPNDRRAEADNITNFSSGTLN
jgi:prepilin-type N-terminal cleavage/methylation domain-containing protein